MKRIVVDVTAEHWRAAYDSLARDTPIERGCLLHHALRPHIAGPFAVGYCYVHIEGHTPAVLPAAAQSLILLFNQNRRIRNYPLRALTIEMQLPTEEDLP